MVSGQVHTGRTPLTVFAVVTFVLGAISCSTANTQPVETQTNCPRTAAAAHGWVAPIRADDFVDRSSLNDWWLYDSPGHAGNGRRTPDAITVADGELTITGDELGNSGGMALRGSGQVYGRWEVCAKSPPAAAAYHSVLLLWPDAEDWSVGGEIDFMEIVDPLRQIVGAALHFGANDQRLDGSVRIDATQWHSWAVEWTPDRIATYVDGVQWWETTDTVHFPPRKMHLCIQLDNFGGDTRAGGHQIVDWARQYPLR
jgi:hypothetical protein